MLLLVSSFDDEFFILLQNLHFSLQKFLIKVYNLESRFDLYSNVNDLCPDVPYLKPGLHCPLSMSQHAWKE